MCGLDAVGIPARNGASTVTIVIVNCVVVEEDYVLEKLDWQFESHGEQQ
jgi:hypothetical protein